MFFSEDNKLSYISSGVFYDTALSGELDLSILSNLERIGSFAFGNTQLTKVTLPPKCRYSYDSFPNGCEVTGGDKYVFK